MRRSQGSDCEWQICKWHKLPVRANIGILHYAHLIPLFWENTETPVQNVMPVLWICTVTTKWRCKAHLQCTKRHNYALHSVAFTDTSWGYGQRCLMYCLPSTNLLMYPLIQFMRISEENKILTNISFLDSNLNGHIHTLNSFKNKCHVTLYASSDCLRSVFIILFVWLMFMWLNASVNEDASPVSWWVHFTDIPDSYSAMFSQHRALWNHCMNPRIPTSLVVCNLNRRNSWHS